MISLKNKYMPQKYFTSVDHPVNCEQNLGVNLNFGQNMAGGPMYNYRKNKSIKTTTDDWHIERSESSTTGVQRLYRFTVQELYKDGENQRNLPSTDIHSGHCLEKFNMGFAELRKKFHRDLQILKLN
ncbi:9322_t:CDS:2 [Diversispora eburnea]|uniref:9322_t:CDS:1 n=1 Tax=Diversispora eburnea TaxID=1213867 RepID=A0A9N9BMT9_9GLOM|nr:9322_t:CDS:2 [Diversispora eburnea]